MGVRPHYVIENFKYFVVYFLKLFKYGIFNYDSEMIANWGTWKDQAPFGNDRAFHVTKK